MRLEDYCDAHGIPFDDAEMDEIFRRTRDAAYKIIDLKGATFYAVASGLMQIVEAILRDQATVLSVSSLVSDYYGIDDICLSLPTVVGRLGVERMLKLRLSHEEVAKIQH